MVDSGLLPKRQLVDHVRLAQDLVYHPASLISYPLAMESPPQKILEKHSDSPLPGQALPEGTKIVQVCDFSNGLKLRISRSLRIITRYSPHRIHKCYRNYSYRSILILTKSNFELTHCVFFRDFHGAWFPQKILQFPQKILWFPRKTHGLPRKSQVYVVVQVSTTIHLQAQRTAAASQAAFGGGLTVSAVLCAATVSLHLTRGRVQRGAAQRGGSPMTNNLINKTSFSYYWLISINNCWNQVTLLG